jgi:hypothetical protein
MQYQRSYLSFFQSPHWAVTLLVGSGCVLIPVIGWAVLVGYLLEVLDQGRNADNEPVFDLERVGDYLVRGFGPTMLQVLVLLPPLLLAGAALWLGFNSPKGSWPKVWATALPPLLLLVTWLFSVLLVPLTLHFGPQRHGLSAGQLTLDFLKHVWRETFLAQLFVLVTGFSLTIVGLVPCGFAAPSAVALGVFAQYQLLAQLNTLYQQRTAAAPATSAQELMSPGVLAKTGP